MAKIFISYRRSDSQHAVDRLQDAMRPYVKNPKRDIFVDVDNIPIGHDFEAHLQGKVGECDALLAVIGPDWLTCQKEDGSRRLDDPEDFVRAELAAALERNIPVVPVLLDGARVPHASELPDNLKALAKRNGAQLDRKSFAADVDHIMTGLGFAKSGGGGAAKWLAGLSVSAVLGLGIWVALSFLNLDGGALERLVFGDDGLEVEEVVETEPDPINVIEAEDTAEFSEPPADAEFRAALVARYQAALGVLEYYYGIVDGVPGDEIHDASKAFTRDYNRTNLALDTGNLDAIERLVVFAEDTMEAMEESETEEVALSPEPAPISVPEPTQSDLDRVHATNMDRIRSLTEAGVMRPSDVETVRPNWAEVVTGTALMEADGCLAGDLNGCSDLGYSFVRGEHGAPLNYGHARTLFERACNGGLMAGCNNLADLYERGLGVSVDANRARELYRQSCDARNAQGCEGLNRLQGR